MELIDRLYRQYDEKSHVRHIAKERIKTLSATLLLTPEESKDLYDAQQYLQGLEWACGWLLSKQAELLIK